MNESLQKKITSRARSQAKNDSISYHITGMRVPLFEVDMGLAVYHGNYYHLFELGREDFLRNIGFPYREFVNRQLHLTIVESQCKYRKALHYDDEIEIHTGIPVMGRRSLTFSQLVYRPAVASMVCETENKHELQLCTEVELHMICVRFAGRPTLLPEDFRLAFEAMLKKE